MKRGTNLQYTRPSPWFFRMSLKLATRHKLYFKFGGASFSFRGRSGVQYSGGESFDDGVKNNTATELRNYHHLDATQNRNSGCHMDLTRDLWYSICCSCRCILVRTPPAKSFCQGILKFAWCYCGTGVETHYVFLIVVHPKNNEHWLFPGHPGVSFNILCILYDHQSNPAQRILIYFVSCCYSQFYCCRLGWKKHYPLVN